MKRVLIVAYYFPPLAGGGVQRPLKFARYLPRHGWLPVILTVRESDSTFNLRDASLCSDVPAGVEIVRAPSPLEKLWNTLPDRVRRYLNVPDPYWSWSVAGLFSVMGLARRGLVDAVVTTSPPHSVHLVGYWLRRWYKIPWIADFRDPWTRIRWQPPNVLRRRLERYWEQRVLAVADHVTVTTHDLEHYFPRGARSSFVTALLNGYDEEDFREVAGDRPPSGPPFQMAYVGDLYDDDTTRVFLTGVEAFLKGAGLGTDAVQLVFAGCPHLELPRSLMPYVRFRGYVPHAEAIRIMVSSHLLVLLTRWYSRAPSLNSEREPQIPGKTYEYLRAGPAILHVAPRPCFATRLIDVLGAGTNVYTTEETARGLADVYERWRQGTLSGRVADVKTLEPFARDGQAAVLADLLTETARRAGEARPGARPAEMQILGAPKKD